MTTIRSCYSKRVRNSFKPVGISLTKQAFKRECDINHILRGYVVPQELSDRKGDFTDLTMCCSYHEAMNKMLAARESFMLLPSDVRKRFDNQPSNFVDFATDPENIDELREMGLAPALDPEPDPVKVNVVNADKGGDE